MLGSSGELNSLSKQNSNESAQKKKRKNIVPSVLFKIKQLFIKTHSYESKQEQLISNSNSAAENCTTAHCYHWLTPGSESSINAAAGLWALLSVLDTVSCHCSALHVKPLIDFIRDQIKPPYLFHTTHTNTIELPFIVRVLAHIKLPLLAILRHLA